MSSYKDDTNNETIRNDKKFKLYALCLENKDLFIDQDDNGDYIFKILNKKKCLYFGITMQKFRKRLSGHFQRMNDLSYPYSQKLYNCLRFYGFANFTKIIIKDNLSEEEAKNIETYYIEKYDTYKNGLNSTLGGESFALGDKNFSASAVKIYNNITGEIKYFTWQGAAAEFLKVTPNQIALAVNLNCQNNSQIYSPKFNTYFQIKYEEDISLFIENMPSPTEKMIASKRNKIIIVNLDTKIEQEFDCAGDAAKYFKIGEHNIWNVLTNKSKQFNIGNNRYDVQKIPKSRDWNFDILPSHKLIALSHSKKIYYLNDNWEEVVFNSRDDAAISTRGNFSISYQARAITKSIQSNGTIKCIAGYYWFRK